MMLTMEIIMENIMEIMGKHSRIERGSMEAEL